MLKKIFSVLAVVSCLIANSNFCDAKIQTIKVEDTTPEIHFMDDVVFARYYTWPESTLKMNLFIPGSEKKLPAVIFIPGGAFINAPRDSGYQLCHHLAENGFVAACIEYRVIGAASYKEIIGDVKAAVRYIRAHADALNVDKNKIAVIGNSAGGYLATMIGVTGGVKNFDFGENLDQSSEVQAVINNFGGSDLAKFAEGFPAEQQELDYSPSSFLSLFVNGVAGYKDKKGGSLLDNPEGLKETNPLNYINKNTPPFLIFHGNEDTTVSPNASKALYDTLEKNGIDATYIVMDGGKHDGHYFYQDKPLKIILDFLNRVLS